MKPNDVIEFAKIVGKLKKTKRMGWVMKGLKNTESVADHSFRVAALAMILSSGKKLNVEKVLKMAVLHDLAEAIIGDIVWEEGEKELMPRAEKIAKEFEALKKIFKNVPGKDEYFALWKEWDEQKTAESQFVQRVDKLETAVQTLEYETGKVDFKYFWIYAKRYLDDDEFTVLYNELQKLRKKK